MDTNKKSMWASIVSAILVAIKTIIDIILG